MPVATDIYSIVFNTFFKILINISSSISVSPTTKSLLAFSICQLASLQHSAPNGVISTIEEGIEVLTGVPAGKKDKNGHFPAGTVNYLVYEKLKKYAKIDENK